MVLDSTRLPRHIAMIMDGNGRWAKRENLPRMAGHRAGAETVRTIAKACRQLGIEYVTLYAFSDENWQRPKTEVAQLMELLATFLVQERSEMRDNQIRLQVIGAIERLPDFVRKVMNETLDFTARDYRMTLNLALSYGSRNEILRAVRKIVEKVERREMKVKDLNEENFSACLDTAGMPDPDLLIRTSGEMRISNFMLWQLAYTEIHVTPTLWPEFREQHLHKAIRDYQSRERRFGLTSEQIQKKQVDLST